jgi:hypothetical protein
VHKVEDSMPPFEPKREENGDCAPHHSTGRRQAPQVNWM